MNMRIVFMGTPESAVASLARLIADGHDVVAVWTQPDKPAGRGDKLHSPPVKEFALKHSLPLEQPAKIKTKEAKELFASYNADVAVVVAYGRILPPEYLAAPKHGCINVHFSLLPRFRGAAPVNWAIVSGEAKTGVTTMFIEEELDSGPLLLQAETSIGDTETAPQLMERLAAMGADLLSETLARLESITPQAQEESRATFARILKRADGFIDWSASAREIERSVRGFQPWPNAFTHHQSRRLIVWNSEVADIVDAVSQPGTVISNQDEIVVASGGGSALRLLEVQPESKRRMSARDFLHGAHLKIGDRFGEV
ncbi:MAG TPA: methionyl-tRNA formyltransferase [Pyrinomonadaceae bacterium]|nr:methionyl-tRNA formyltransferase [Pyrinomonadaceae bacterium]